jgi:hypothetical protein
MTARRHKHPLIYWAGPIGQHDFIDGVDQRELRCLRAIEDADTFWSETGAYPIVPHLHHWWDVHRPHEYEDWIGRGMDTITMCDAFYRMPGTSSGSDREQVFAESIGMPVFTDRALLAKWVEEWHADWARRDAFLTELLAKQPAKAKADEAKVFGGVLSSAAMLVGAAGYVFGKKGGEDRLLARLSEILACMPNEDEVFHAVKFLLERNQRVDEYLINYKEYGTANELSESLRRFDEKVTK